MIPLEKPSARWSQGQNGDHTISPSGSRLPNINLQLSPTTRGSTYVVRWALPGASTENYGSTPLKHTLHRVSGNFSEVTLQLGCVLPHFSPSESADDNPAGRDRNPERRRPIPSRLLWPDTGPTRYNSYPERGSSDGRESRSVDDGRRILRAAPSWGVPTVGVPTEVQSVR